MKAIISFVITAILLVWHGGFCEEDCISIEVESPSVSGQVISDTYKVVATMGGSASCAFSGMNQVTPLLGAHSGTAYLRAGIPGSSLNRWTFDLEQNCPDPFTEGSQIRFCVPGLSGESRNVIAKLFDVTGRVVDVLPNGELPAGQHGSALVPGRLVYPVAYALTAEDTLHAEYADTAGATIEAEPCTMLEDDEQELDQDWDYWDNEPDMFAMPSGDIGIGTSTPDAKLEVNGTFGETSLKLSAAAGDTTMPREELFERFMVEMSDGVHLATDVYYPRSGEGPWPVLLCRTPYNIAGHPIGTVAGYVQVLQNIRGCGDSEGLFRLFLDDGWGPDQMDGRETVEWIRAQAWCDGHTGTGGGSAPGVTQNLLAGSLPDDLFCQYVGQAPTSLYHHLCFPGGALREGDIVNWLAGQDAVYMLDSLEAHPNYDQWWTYLDTSTRDSLITVPTYQKGGWYDMFTDGQIAKFIGLQFGGGPGARGNQKLIMGPWAHGGESGELTYPPNADLFNGEALIGGSIAWRNYWLRGGPGDIMELPAIAYYVMGDVDDPSAPGNEWRTGEQWPPPEAVDEIWYLHTDGSLGLTPPGPDDPSASYYFDPHNPVPTIGGGNLYGLRGPYDQRSIENRQDVLVYSSPVLSEPVEICGPVRLNLHVSSDRVDTDFTGKLCDVYPDGRSMLVCDGILRARHRQSMTCEDFLVPGEVYELEILVGNTCICFNQGHRIRIAVSSSNANRFGVNPNTGVPFAMDYDEMLIAHNTIYLDAARPSYAILPITLGHTAGAPTQTVSDLHTIYLHPNPTSGPTAICFDLPSATHVSLMIFDARGRAVDQLFQGLLTRGPHGLSWDGTTDARNHVQSGVYFLRLKADDRQMTSRIVVVR